MSASYWFDASRVLDRVRAGLGEGLDEAAERIAGNARQRAPIRKVFKEGRGYRERTRALTRSEMNQAATRSVRFYYARMAAAATSKPYAKAESAMLRSVGSIRSSRAIVPRRGSANSLANSRGLRQLGTITGGRFTSTSGAARLRGAGYEPGADVRGALTPRGLYEVRSGRAIHINVIGRGGVKQVQIGGALKASITTRPADSPSAGGIAREVVAAIRYAKFVEFPTTHNRAQPFLLPALKDEQRTFVRDVAASIRRSLGGG